jgi:hypothetical protein
MPAQQIPKEVMTLYKFTWPAVLIYPDIGLTAHPGDECEFQTPPDSRWIPVTASTTAPEPVTGSGGVVLPKAGLSKSQIRRVAATTPGAEAQEI